LYGFRTRCANIDLWHRSAGCASENLRAKLRAGEAIHRSGGNTVNSTNSARLAACSLAMLVLIVQALPALSQTGGLPPPSTFIGILHRAPDGTIVVEPPSATPQSSAPVAPSRRNPAKGASNSGGHPSAPSPAAATPSPGGNGPSSDTAPPSAAASSAPPQPKTDPTTFRSLSPDELDDVSCKTIAWENRDYDQCRRDLKEERAHVTGAQTGTAASILFCTNCR